MLLDGCWCGGGSVLQCEGLLRPRGGCRQTCCCALRREMEEGRRERNLKRGNWVWVVLREGNEGERRGVVREERWSGLGGVSERDERCGQRWRKRMGGRDGF
ncbi:hypothetical protein MRB53_033158 [Persea americana]|uniref:Uncharacterized protein n=1 Tax=Persea americana TaxID=3435 RepID=A0ACC2KUF4_PERAE|nr:hypothetical protein MRB53_033158 [Persea americana]